MGQGKHRKGRGGPSVPAHQRLPGSEDSLFEEAPPASERNNQQRALPCNRKLITDFLQTVPGICLLGFIALLVLIIIVLGACLAVVNGSAAGDFKCGKVLPPCDDGWIWYLNKCYYFSETEGNWTEAKDSCAALNSTLAMIDTREELDFMLRYKGDPDHWIGLWRDSDDRWRCINGTEFSNWFLVADQGHYAYLNHRKVKSGDNYNTRNWVCNKVSMFERKC